MSSEMRLGAALVSDRLRMGVSQAQFASILSVSQQSLSKWESGVSLPRDHRLHSIRSVLGDHSTSAQVIGGLLAAKLAVRGPQRVAFDTELIAGGHNPAESPEWREAFARRQAYQQMAAAARPTPAPLTREEIIAKAAADIAAATAALARATELMASVIKDC